MTTDRHAELDAAEHALSVAFVLARAHSYRSEPRMRALTAAEDRYRRACQRHREEMGLSSGPGVVATVDLRQPQESEAAGSGRRP